MGIVCSRRAPVSRCSPYNSWKRVLLWPSLTVWCSPRLEKSLNSISMSTYFEDVTPSRFPAHLPPVYSERRRKGSVSTFETLLLTHTPRQTCVFYLPTYNIVVHLESPSHLALLEQNPTTVDEKLPFGQHACMHAVMRLRNGRVVHRCRCSSDCKQSDQACLGSPRIVKRVRGP